MNDDDILLRRFAEEDSEAAFTELVRRHVDLVYGAALRRTGGDTHRAADVAQHVFISLARQARRLSRQTILAAWLHTATRNAALNLMLSDQRRRARESAVALDPATAAAAPAPAWEELRPTLDAAIDELPESDRAAVVLRFLEHRAFADIGIVLHISADAARMRTDRALDKLRAALARRGITSTAAALGALVSSQAGASAPAGLAATLAAQSLAAVAVDGGLLATFATLMNPSTLVSVGFSAVVAFGAGAYFGVSRSFDDPPPPRIETPRHSELIGSLRRDNATLQAEVGRLNGEVSRLNAAQAEPRAKAATVPAPATVPNAPTLARGQVQRSVLNNLRQLSAAIDQFRIDNKRPPTSLDELVGETKYIRRLVSIEGENYATASLQPNQALVVTTTAGTTIVYDPSGNNTTVPEPLSVPPRLLELQARLKPAIDQAVAAYRTAHGKNPPTPEAVLPYFTTPQQGADFVELIEATKMGK